MVSLFARLSLTWLVLATTAGAARASVDLDRVGERLLRHHDLQYLVDDDAALDGATALAATGWRPVSDRIPNFGYTNAAVWLRGELRNGGDRADTWLLEVGYPNLDEVELWLARRGVLSAPVVTGDSRPFAQRPIVDRNFVFPVDLAAGETVQVLLRVRSTTSVQVPIRVWSRDAFRESAHVSTLFHGIFFGIMFVMSMYNLFIFISIRESAYLYYVGFVVSFALYQGFHHGFTYAHLWPSAPWWHDKSGAVAISLTLGCAGCFAHAFLSLRDQRPRAARTMRVFTVLAFANAVVALAVPHSVSARVASVLALILAPLVLATGISLWRGGMTAARYFVLAWVSFLAGATLFALSKLGILPHNAVTENALQIGSVAEVMLLSFALGDRINAERRARHQARLDAVLREQETAALSRYVPAAVTERVLAGDRGALERARRDVAVVCAVPFGFLESVSTLEPDQVAPPVNVFVEAMSELARAHGGVVDRFVGPRIVVLFGALEDAPLADSCRAAAKLAQRMQHKVNQLVRTWESGDLGALKLRMAVGIAAGNAVVGTFGADVRGEYAALGGPAVRAHQLASDAIPGETRLDERAASHLRANFVVTEGAAVEYAPGESSRSFRLGEDAPTTTATTTRALGLGDTAAAGDGATPQADPSGRGPALPALAPDTMFDGRYRILGEVGRGGTAVVYRARHEAGGQERALKLIAPALLADAFAVEQLRREATATARIKHASAVQLHDFGRSVEGHYYMALDFVDGPSLATLLARNGPLPPNRAVELAIEILRALDAAHALELVHRDVKPANVLIDGDGRARVTDFGLVQPLSGIGESVVVGTPHYMSPEQSRGTALDARSDLYSFGVTLYEMLSGTLPYRDATDPTALLRGVRKEPPVPIGERNPAVPEALWRVIEQCLAKSAADRPASASEVIAALSALTGARGEEATA